MGRYNSKASRLRYASPSTHLWVLGGIAFFVGGACLLARSALHNVIPALSTLLGGCAAGALVFACVVAVMAAAIWLALPAEVNICQLVRRSLFCPAYGNPLHLKDGELLPPVSCTAVNAKGHQYILTIRVRGCTLEDIKALSSFISSSLTGRYKNYAVVAVQPDESFNYVDFALEDVTIDKRLVVHSVEEMRPASPTILNVQQGAAIDLTTSGSMIVAGKTRSGKTTGIISLMLQALAWGPDRYGSQITIIDPKQAELSRLPHVVTIDEDGKARAILAAMRSFAELITRRQAVLNELSEKSGNAVHWWEAGMHVSLLFIDEFVACRTLFPKRAEKDDPEYCLAEFDGLLKRVVTMGASAGCYVIISIAEASVEEGGLPAMLRSAMSTKILFRPTLPEARLLWSSDKLETMLERTYGPGDAWFSSTDGVHDEVSLVRFPRMDFPVYKELDRLLQAYGLNSTDTPHVK